MPREPGRDGRRAAGSRHRGHVLDEHPFALCLTHDVDRPYKTVQSVYYAIRERQPGHLADALPARNPYWQFEEIMDLEADLGVRSAFYFLNQPSIRERPASALTRPGEWVQHLGRYDVRAPAIVEVMRRLHDRGWEVGLHGSYGSARDRDRLWHEKAVLEGYLRDRIVGGRQHHLDLERPDTWAHHAAIGLRYDASLGSGETYGFDHGYEPIRPFDDEFVVFPLTVMEQALPDPATDAESAWDACAGLLEEAAANGAVMSVLWHPRYFSERDFPGHRGLYRRLVERALEMGAWVGPPAECYRRLDREHTVVDAPLAATQGG